ncbi:SCP2 sterol-binding domain-containing protein [Psychrosphaera ytuae]|uniref:Ubiquinone biosynthesis accessory factor UbiJ n=1 Tax=Psychrosphaera ytuae TaxID=2820710 RepID=A0A975HHG0_9GAMM|nr:SCP2 sterol-binding domain-containing protein [Psychrosphaera ytuae]QTH63027.1 SCP2 sterol-binding domain-containing protein [Psychrosphaera ytuae]
MVLIQQALLSIAEPMLNHVLQYDSDASNKLKKLNNKSLSVELTDLSVNLTVKVFDNKVFVSGQSEPADCVIKTSLDGLQKLSDAAQITAMIRQGQLDLEGDLHVAQGFSGLLMDNDIDWQEWLSEYLGDAMTFKLSQAIKKQKTHWARKKRDLDYTAQSALVDELRVTPDRIEVERFVADVDQLNAQTERLTLEIQKLKAQL